jgi:hypothetical protein
MAGTRRRSTVVGAVLLPAAASALAVGLSTGTASAELVEKTVSWTFTNNDGVDVTCDVFASQEWPFTDDNTARVVTSASGPAPCTDGTFNQVSVNYDDPEGDSKFANATGIGSTVLAHYHDVAANLVSFHVVQFTNCSDNCITDPIRLRQPK